MYEIIDFYNLVLVVANYAIFAKFANVRYLLYKEQLYH